MHNDIQEILVSEDRLRQIVDDLGGRIRQGIRRETIGSRQRTQGFCDFYGRSYASH